MLLEGGAGGQDHLEAQENHALVLEVEKSVGETRSFKQANLLIKGCAKRYIVWDSRNLLWGDLVEKLLCRMNVFHPPFSQPRGQGHGSPGPQDDPGLQHHPRGALFRAQGIVIEKLGNPVEYQTIVE